MSETSINPDVDEGEGHLDRNTVVERYAYLVNKVAYKLLSRLPPNVELDDLKSAGVIGLIDAAEKYDSSRSSFRSYAEIRIRGAIIDELRQLDWVPRTVRQSKASIERARLKLVRELGRPATDAELAFELGLTAEEFTSKASRAEAVAVVSVEDLANEPGTDRNFLDTVADPKAPTPEQNSTGNQEKVMMMAAMQRLEERERVVVGLYYFEEMSLREIGTILGVTESRISQIHTKAVRRLRELIEEEIL